MVCASPHPELSHVELSRGPVVGMALPIELVAVHAAIVAHSLAMSMSIAIIYKMATQLPMLVDTDEYVTIVIHRDADALPRASLYLPIVHSILELHAGRDYWW